MFRPNQEFRDAVTYQGAHSDWNNLPADVIARIDDPAYDEPRWTVRLANGKKVTVGEECLSPAPDAPETLAERFQQFTSDFESPLVAAFVLEAVDRYATDILRDEAETLRQMENTLVAGPAWIAAAKRAKAIASMK